MATIRLNLPPRGASASAENTAWSDRGPERVPERLVGLGFRCGLTGVTSATTDCWEFVATAYGKALGTGCHTALLLDLTRFVTAVSASSERAIHVQAASCRGFCRDECLAISIIAATQHGAHNALRASASALLGTDDIGDTLSGAETFARHLKSVHQVLAIESVCPATCALRVGPKSLM